MGKRVVPVRGWDIGDLVLALFLVVVLCVSTRTEVAAFIAGLVIGAGVCCSLPFVTRWAEGLAARGRDSQGSGGQCVSLGSVRLHPPVEWPDPPQKPTPPPLRTVVEGGVPTSPLDRAGRAAAVALDQLGAHVTDGSACWCGATRRPDGVVVHTRMQ